MRNIMYTKRTNFINPTQIRAIGKPVNNPKDVQNTFNNFFTSIAPNTEQSIPKSHRAPSTYLKNKINTNFIIAHTTNEGLMNIILLIDENKSALKHSSTS